MGRKKRHCNIMLVSNWRKRKGREEEILVIEHSISGVCE